MQAVRNARSGQSEVSAQVNGSLSIYGERPRIDRRRHRRCSFETRQVALERIENRDQPVRIGHLLNLSAGGLRFRTRNDSIKVGTQIRVRLRLPDYAGICPFVSPDGSGQGTNEWMGWITVMRVHKSDNNAWDVAARLLDMREIDRGMLTLYLSAQPLAA